MKISVIITTFLITQVSASFFDVFQGAVLSVQNSFGKLLSDVVTDVRDTVDCTILAVEHVLSLSDDATAQYYKKCGSPNKTDSADGAPQSGSLPKVEVSLEFSNKGENLQKEIPVDIEAKINESLSKVLGNYNPHDNLLSVENVLSKESEQLTDVSKLVKQELNKLSNDVHTDLNNIKQRDSEPSVDTILQEIKVLENKEHNTKNASEATEIHHVIDEVLTKLGGIEVTEATENIKLDEILRNLEKNSNNSFIGLRQQFEEWKETESRHLAEIKNKIEEHEKNTALHGHIYNLSDRLNYTQPIHLYTEMLKNAEPPEIRAPTEEPLHTKTLSQESITQASTESTQLIVQLKGMFDSTTKSLQTRNEMSSKKNTFLSTLESNSVTGTIAHSTTFSTDKPTAIKKRVSNEVSNDTVTSTTLQTFENGNIRPVEIKTYNNANKESSVTASAPTTVLNVINENLLNKTVIKNSVQIMESTSVGTVFNPVEINTNFNRDLPSIFVNKSIDTITSSLANATNVSNEAEAELTLTTKNSSNNDILNDTPITSTAVPISKTVQIGRATSTASSNELKTNPALLNDNYFNDTVTTTTKDSITKGGTILSIENKTTLGSEEFSTVTTNQVTSISSIAPDSNSNDTIVTNTLSSIIPTTPIGAIVQTVGPISGNGENSSVAINNFTTSAATKDNDLSNNMTTNTPLTLMVSTPVTMIIQLAVTTAASTMKVSLSIPSTSTSETIQNQKTIAVSDTEKSSSVTINNFTTSAMTKDSDLNDNMATNTLPTLIVSTPMTNIIQHADTTAASTVATRTTTIVSTSISEATQSKENIAVSGNEKSSAVAINNTTTSAVKKDSDLNYNIVTNSPVTSIVSTPMTNIIQYADTTAVSTMEASLSIPRTSISETIQTTETIAFSDTEKSSPVAINNFTASAVTKGSDLNQNMATNAPLTLIVSTPMTNIIQHADTMAVSTMEASLSIPRTSISETIQTTETFAFSDTEKSSSVAINNFTASAVTKGSDLNQNMATNAPLTLIVSTPMTNIIQHADTTAASTMEASLSIPRTSISETIQTTETIAVSDTKKSSSVVINNFTISAVKKDSDLNDNMTTSTPLTSIVSTPVTNIIQHADTTAASIMEASLGIPSTSTSETIQTQKTIAVSDTEKSSAVAINNTTTSAVEKDSDLNYNIATNSPLTSIVSTLMTNIIQHADTTAASTVVPRTTSIPSTSISDTIQTVETIAVSDTEKSSPVAINNFIASAVTKGSDLNHNMATNAPLTLIVSTPMTNIIQHADTTAASTMEASLSIPRTISETIQTTETIAVSDTEKSSSIVINNFTTSTVTKDSDLNNNMATNTPLTLIVSTPITDIIQFTKTTAASIESPLTTSIPSTSMSDTMQTKETITVSDAEKSSSVSLDNFTTSAVTKDSDLNDNMATNTPPTLIVSTPITDIIQLTKATAASSLESPVTTSIPNTSMSETIQTEETIAVSGDEETPSVTIDSSTTSAETKDSYFNDNKATTTPLTLILSTLTNDIIQLVETTAASIEAPLTTSIPVSTPIADIIDDASVTSSSSSILGSTTVLVSDISESIENTTTENEGLSETTPIPVKSTTPITNEELVASTTIKSVDIPKITNHNDVNDAVTTDGNNQAVEIGTDLELSSASDIATTSTVFTLTENTPNIREITSSTNRNGDYRDLYTTPSFLPSPKIYKHHDLNHDVTSRPTFSITEGPFVDKKKPFFQGPINPANRAWLPPMQHETKPYKLKQQIFPNTNGVPINNYASNTPQSLRDGSSHLNPAFLREKSTIPARNLYHNPYFANPVQPNYNDLGESINSIRKRSGTLAIDKDSKMLTSDRYSPNIYNNQQPNRNTGEIMNPINKFLNFGAPLGKGALRKLETLPLATTINKEDVPRRLEKTDYVNHPHVEIPKNRNYPPYSWDKRAPNKSSSSRVLTTHRPMSIGARRLNNNDKPPFDYDSFFHTSQNANEAHQQALREARELIEQSKRSRRIIDTIFKNKNNKRSIFSNPGTLNSGK